MFGKRGANWKIKNPVRHAARRAGVEGGADAVGSHAFRQRRQVRDRKHEQRQDMAASVTQLMRHRRDV